MILSTQDHSVIAFTTTPSTPSLLLDLPQHRTHLLFHLLSSLAHQSFKLHFTANLLLKERFSLSLIQSAIKHLASKKDTEDEESKGATDLQDEEEPFFPGGGDGNFSTESFFEEVYKQNLGAA